ncbi:PA14 domain-containing protein [Cerasicoccus maritimus]|uniref:PA14 domain-containing protein n=1 Tax=Cerasicoccus maritimus TaxID=490089 RepID=UPI0028525A27|nr:PA14 domain-containing protein [Cerasicoccus maritimus]
MRRVNTIRLAGCISLCLTINTAFGQTVLPFETDFEPAEGYQVGTFTTDSNWQVEAGSPEITDLDSASGQQALFFTLIDAPHVIEASFTGQQGPIVFVDFYLKPEAGEVDDLPNGPFPGLSAQTGFVRVSEEGEVIAMHGDGAGSGEWIYSGERYVLSSGASADWHRFTYRLNYSTKTWDLYLDDQLVLVDLGFLDASLLSFSSFRISSDGQASLGFDFFYAGEVNPIFADLDLDGIPDAYETAQGMNVNLNDRYGDLDFDRLTNLTEYLFGTDAGDPDSDGDGMSDWRELATNADPLTLDNYVFTAIPFWEGFESNSSGPLSGGNWLASSTLATVASDNPHEGAQLLSVEAEEEEIEVSNLFSGDAFRPVWVDFQLMARPLRDAPTLDEGSSVGFYFSEDGRLMVFDGNSQGGGAWRALDAPVLEADAWRRLTVYLDYSLQKWAIWVDGVREEENLGYAYSVPFFTEFSMKTGASGSSALDAFSVSYSEPAELDNDGDGLINALEDLNANGVVDAGETSKELYDTDSDGFGDGLEMLYGKDPLMADPDIAPLADDGNGGHFWATSFAVSEGYASAGLNGQNYWDAANVNVTPEEEAELTSDEFSIAEMKRFVGAGELNQVWLSFRAKLSAGVLPDPASLTGPTAGVFGFTTENDLQVFDPDAGEWLKVATGVTATEWNHYAAFLDYEAKEWLLAINGVIVVRNIPFVDDSLQTFSRFRALQAVAAEEETRSAYFDEFLVSSYEPAGMDFDGDGLNNELERLLGSNLNSSDSDEDGMPDYWEHGYGLDLLANDGSDDLDGDGLSNLDEFLFGLDPSSVEQDALPGVVNWHTWTHLSGKTVDALTGHSKFPLEPDRQSLLSELTTENNDPGESNYGARIRGVLIAPVSGEYTFWLASDNNSELWLSTDETTFGKQQIAMLDTTVSFQDWDRFQSQRSAPIQLTAGEAYYFEVLHKESTGRDHVSVAWSYPGQARIVVPGEHLMTASETPNDADQDGLPDDWETLVGLDPLAGYGVDGFSGDKDSDGVLNYEELQYGSHPGFADTDGDGYGDWTEIHELGTDPGTAESVAWQQLVELSGNTAAIDSGFWQSTGLFLLGAGQGGGRISWNVDLLEDGIYQLKNSFIRIQDTAASVDQPIVFLWYLDGELIGTTETDASGSGSKQTTAYLRTPYVLAGAHQLSLRWMNVYSGNAIMLESLTIEEPVEQAPENLESWQQAEIAKVASLDSLTAVSYVSPYCLEGDARFLSRLSLGEGIDPIRTGKDRWYANVPLSEDEPTEIAASFQDGGYIESAQIDWAPTNLFDVESIRIREGDSLKLFALPEGQLGGSFSVSINGVEIASGATDSVVRAFFESGEYLIDAVYVASDLTEYPATAIVTVVGIAPPTDSPTIWTERLRPWKWEGAPEGITFDADGMLLSLESHSGGIAAFVLGREEAYADVSITARLEEGGPVLATAPTNAFWLRAAVEGYLPAVELDESTWEVHNTIFMYGLPDSTDVLIDVFKAGVVLSDGERQRFLTNNDFSELGVYSFSFIKPTEVGGGPCHRIKAYQDSLYLGRR